MTKTVFYAARLMAVFFFIAAIIAWRLPPSFAGRDGKAWVFLLLCLLLGPGLMANVVFKDHWGRARPRDIAAFGGPQSFTPAFAVSKACTRNCSFVSGDGAFGFFLPSFAYGAARGKRKRVFWGAMALGGVIGAGRIVMGAHFLSDVLCAMVISLAVSAALHALFYGTHATKACWNDWLFFKKTA